MSEYFFVKESQTIPIYSFPEEYEEGAFSTIFTFPSKPIPLLAKYKPEEDYEISDVLIDPELLISKYLFDNINLGKLYGSNWIPIKLIDKGEHDYFMLQLANEIDIICHENSDFKRFKRGNITGMRAIVIDEKKNSSIPLKKRLMFRDKAWGFHIFFHESIVNAINAESPSGIEFIPVENFNESWAG